MTDPWPNLHQELLLKAAHLQGTASIRAWAQWKVQIDLDSEHIDSGSYRLLALVHRNLSRQHVEDPLLGRLKGVSRLSWTRNQTLLRAIAPVLHELSGNGIKPLLIDDAALSLFHFGDLGLWPINEFVVLVPRTRVRCAATLLSSAGWRSNSIPAKQLDDEFLAGTDSLRFCDDQGRLMQLRWRLAGQGCGEPDDESLWVTAEHTSLDGEVVGVLSAADQLLETIADALLPGRPPTIEWLAAVAQVLRDRDAEVDWNRLLDRAARSRLVLILRETVDYLDSLLGVTLQTCHRETLVALPVSRAEQQEFDTWTRTFPLLGEVPRIFLRYQRNRLQQDPEATSVEILVGFPRYLQRLRGHKHLGQVAWWMVKRLVARFTKAAACRLQA